MYTIRQTKLKKCFFDLIENTQTKEYNFDRYKEALIFALSEQIKFIYSIPCENCKPILKKPFELYLSEKEFILASKQNPFFYLGVHNFERVNIKNFYYYLISQNKLQKLKKYK
jgi:hypothetical protein